MVNRAFPQADGLVYRISRSRPIPSAIRGQVSHVRDPNFWRKATCEEVGCISFLKGWVTTLDMSPDQESHEIQMNQTRYKYIKDKSGREFTESIDEFVMSLRFNPGQTCFSAHHTPIQIDPTFIIMGKGTRSIVDYDEFFRSVQ